MSAGKGRGSRSHKPTATKSRDGEARVDMAVTFRFDRDQAVMVLRDAIMYGLSLRAEPADLPTWTGQEARQKIAEYYRSNGEDSFASLGDNWHGDAEKMYAPATYAAIQAEAERLADAAFFWPVFARPEGDR